MKKNTALHAGVVAALLTTTATSALAREFVLGDGVTATTNVSASIGVSFRADDRDEDIIAPANGARQGQPGFAAFTTADDGTLNYDRGDIVSAPITVIGDVDFNVDNTWGVFVRAKAVTDLALEFMDVDHGHTPNDYRRSSRLNDDDFNNLAQFSNVALLDAFAYADVDIADTPTSFRLGRQVLSWGEGLFLRGGVNTINPIDVSAVRRPGTQVKEALLPVGMAYVNAGLTADLSVEGFLQFEHQKTVLDGCGTFFSTNDVIAEGCNGLTLFNDVSSATGAVNLPTDPVSGSALQRGEDIEPDDFSAEQGGAALRYYTPALDTEFGLFYTRTHSKTPTLGFYAGGKDLATAGIIGGATLTAVLQAGLAPNFETATGGLVDATEYAAEYVEDIDMFGASFSTNVFGLAIAGEASYRPNQPVQINTADLTVAAASGGSEAITAGLLGAPVANPANVLFADATAGEFVSGYSEAQQFKGQISAVKFIDRALGADRITLVGEIGFERLVIDDGDMGYNYGRSSAYGNPNSFGNDAPGLITDLSYGYILRTQATYSDVFMGVNFTPALTFKHDIEGTSSDGVFEDNRKSIGLGLNFDYLNRYNVGLDYVNVFDGKFSVSKDRDFIAATARVQF